ncbi:sigma 54-interacting transcriptional regulator, partial [Stutzerimonas stutzeri]
RRLRDEVRRFQQLLSDDRFHGMLGRSRVMRGLFDQIRQLARAEGPVLVIGESGTGKELVARAVHAESERAGGPFLAINCAGLPAE